MTGHDTSPVPAQASASVALVRDGLHGLEVLMMRRAKTMKFAPGAFVFPGGKIDAGDGRDYFWRKHLNPLAAHVDMDHRIGVLRELYEEAGILYTESQQPRQHVARPSLPAALTYAGEALAVQDLHLFAHWITPIQGWRRFDTRFYLAPYYGEQDAIEDGSEMTEKMWVKPKSLLDRWEKGDLALMFPTRLNLKRLSEANSVAEAITQTAKRNVIPILPHYDVDETTGKKTVTIPIEAGYGEIVATDKDLSAEAKIMKRFT